MLSLLVPAVHFNDIHDKDELICAYGQEAWGRDRNTRPPILLQWLPNTGMEFPTIKGNSHGQAFAPDRNHDGLI